MTDPNALHAPNAFWTPGTEVSVSRNPHTRRDVVEVSQVHPSPFARAVADRLMDSPHLLADERLAACVGRLRACEDPAEVIVSTLLAYAEATAGPHE
jgi:hypothetical protein